MSDRTMELMEFLEKENIYNAALAKENDSSDGYYQKKSDTFRQCVQALRNAQNTREALELILPLAKGYAAQHPVGSNSRYIEIAESALIPTKPEPIHEGDIEREFEEWKEVLAEFVRIDDDSGLYTTASASSDLVLALDKARGLQSRTSEE